MNAMSSYFVNPQQPPMSLFYATRAVNNSDLDYFIESFEQKYDKFRETYLLTKESLMGLSYRYSHYSPLDFERKMKEEVDRLLARWEQWFVRTLELTKGIAHLKKEFLIKKQYEVSGLTLPEYRIKELHSGYFNLLYQYEINEKDRQDINAAIEEVKRNTYGSVPGVYEKIKAYENGNAPPGMRIGGGLPEPPPNLSWKPLSLGEKVAAKNFMDKSYQQLGGKDQSYYKNIQMNFEELDNLKKYSELELARNATNPEKSRFLTAPLDQSEMSQAALNGTRILADSLKYGRGMANENLDLSREVTRYIAFRKMEKSREENMRTMIENATSLLEEADMPPGMQPSEVVDVKELLQDTSPALGLPPIQEVNEEQPSIVANVKESVKTKLIKDAPAPIKGKKKPAAAAAENKSPAPTPAKAPAAGAKPPAKGKVTTPAKPAPASKSVSKSPDKSPAPKAPAPAKSKDKKPAPAAKSTDKKPAAAAKPKKK